MLEMKCTIHFHLQTSDKQEFAKSVQWILSNYGNYEHYINVSKIIYNTLNQDTIGSDDTT